jgi:hypothetical protein
LKDLKMNKKAIIYQLCSMFLLGSIDGVMVAQSSSDPVERTEEARPFDESVWQQLNEELDYSGEAPTPKRLEEKEEQEAFEFPTLSPLVQFILLGILIALLAWLVYSIVVASERTPSATKLKTTDTPEKLTKLKRLEEELDKSDVYPLLFQAEQDKNYHLAVRLHFLALLKKLHTSGNIRWKKDLTNRAYLRQMRPQPDYPAFRSLTHTFERVWYGHQIPDELEYQQIKAAFYAFKPVAKMINTPADE